MTETYPNPFGEPPQTKTADGCMRFWWVLLLLPVVGIGSCVAIGAVGFRFVKAPIKAAVSSVNENAEINAKLGEVSQTTGFSVNNYENKNGNGGADVDFNVKGPNGTANIKGRMQLIAGQWSPEDITVTCSDGTEFSLP